jgi:protein-S-isoprenylcysteine O-methyltransferase Ste14
MAPRSSQRERRIRADTAWFLAGYAGTASFFALEAANRKPGTASSLEISSDDHGTTRGIVIAYAVAADLPILLRRQAVPQLPRFAGPVGLGVQACGLALRTWSMRALGDSYTRTLRTEDEQRVVETGPYRWIRHPGYTGSLLTWIGYALTSRSVPALGVIAALLGRVYQKRITAEETLLARALPGYTDYSHHTKRLVPFVW